MTGSTLQVSGLDHVVLYCRDTARASAFYTDTLGMKVHSETEDYVFLGCGAQVLALFRNDDAQPSRRKELNHLAFTVESTYDDTLARLRAQGLEVTTRDGDPRCIYLLDPDGHRIQLLARPD